ncbi:hypothetical protein DDE01_11650 [Desulfovibrio desulfuricans]|nr:hypothetical protein DDE01_11650 [Desulfovibrio desulfuricans]
MELVLTTHAVDRCLSRGIPQPAVAAVMVHGEHRPDGDDKFAAELEGLRAIYAVRGGVARVVTVMHINDQPTAAVRQRRAAKARHRDIQQWKRDVRRGRSW